MDVITLDFETFWSQDHSLSKMLPSVYCLHPETEIISCSIKVNHYPTDVFFGEAAVAKAFDTIRSTIESGMLLAHNMSGFDCMIAKWRFNLNPKVWGCTLAMARPKYERTVGLSLAKLVKHFGLGVKNNAALMNTKGKHLCDFTPAEIEAMRIYNRDDTDQCKALFDILVKETNPYELWQMDSLMRALIEPAFVLNVPLLETALLREKAKKRKSLLALAVHLGLPPDMDDDTTAGAVRDTLMSAPKFCDFLKSQGVEIPTKISPSDPDEEKLIPALAKDDEGFIALQEHENELVAAATLARLEAKSTLLESRIESFLEVGRYCGGKLPIPSKYYGGHTGRDSGEQYNPQNMPRIVRDANDKIVPKLTNALRLSLTAPPGHVVGVADLSGIELRINHFLWQVESTMRLYREKADADLYRAGASRLHGCKPEEVTKPQRQVQKVKDLGLGFGAGHVTFKDVARKLGGLKITLDESRQFVNDWRNQYPEIVYGWESCHNALEYIRAGKPMPIDHWGLLQTTPEGILMAGRRLIRYPNLRQEVVQKGKRKGEVSWMYGDGRWKRYIYGGKIDENCVQGLGALVMMDAVLEFFKQTRDSKRNFPGWRPALRVHDEPIYVWPEKEAPTLLTRLQEILRTPPTWWPELITWSEGDIAPAYGLAK